MFLWQLGIHVIFFDTSSFIVGIMVLTCDYNARFLFQMWTPSIFSSRVSSFDCSVKPLLQTAVTMIHTKYQNMLVHAYITVWFDLSCLFVVVLFIVVVMNS